MATRSGKRIHASLDNIDVCTEVILKSERKRKVKRIKEKDCEDDCTVSTKKCNYVTYPKDMEEIKNAEDNSVKSTRKLRSNPKEQIFTTNLKKTDENIDKKKCKQKRRNKKIINDTLSEKENSDKVNIETNSPELNEGIDSSVEHVVKSTRNVRKYSLKKQNVILTNIENFDQHLKTSKVRQQQENNFTTSILKEYDEKLDLEVNNDNHNTRQSMKKVNINAIELEVNNDLVNCNVKATATAKKTSKRKKDKKRCLITVENVDKCQLQNSTLNQDNASVESLYRNVSKPKSDKHVIDNHCELGELKASHLNPTVGSDESYEKSSSSCQTLDNKNSTILNDIDDKFHNRKFETINETNFAKTEENMKDTTLDKGLQKFDSTFERISVDELQSVNLNSNERSQELSINSFECSKHSLNTTYEKSSSDKKIFKLGSLDSTYDKENNTDLNYENDEIANGTFDKSDEYSCNSLNDSKTDNIKPSSVIIESSTKESKKIPPKDRLHQTSNGNIKNSSRTPLKRENTFTIETPNVTETPVSQTAKDKTPDRRKSIPFAGCTPYTVTKSSQKSQTILNRTHSIEKSFSVASTMEPVPKTTKVMFYSPVNNSPYVPSEIKKKVIKSSLKGSNKSFVVDESFFKSVRPASRKRSYTQHDEDENQSKRSRLTDEMQRSVDRLSRPRTVSATAKLMNTTTTEKAGTPTKTKPEKTSRTRLPNFAALHQKQFNKMESLDECQERKAKRARQLLTPSGSISLRERKSQRENAAESTVKPPIKESKDQNDKEKPKEITLASLIPGYTRFGFKMNHDVNPFSATNKETQFKAREKKSNATLTREPTLPSLKGTTSARKEAAKRTVMRENTFIGKKDKRTEYRSMIKGVRTNRRFELQMQMRNIN